VINAETYAQTHTCCVQIAEIEGRELIIKDPPHLSSHPNRISEKEQFWHEERRMKVRGYAKVPGHQELHELPGNIKNLQQCVGTKGWQR